MGYHKELVIERKETVIADYFNQYHCQTCLDSGYIMVPDAEHHQMIISCSDCWMREMDLVGPEYF